MITADYARTLVRTKISNTMDKINKRITEAARHGRKKIFYTTAKADNKEDIVNELIKLGYQAWACDTCIGISWEKD